MRRPLRHTEDQEERPGPLTPNHRDHQILISNCANPEAIRWRSGRISAELLLGPGLLCPEKYEPQPLEQLGFDAGRLRVRGWGLTRRVSVNDNVEGWFRPVGVLFYLMSSRNSLMRPRAEPDNAQYQRREYSDIQHCINHASPPLKADLPLEVLICRNQKYSQFR